MSYDETTLSMYLAHRAELVNYASGIVGCRAEAEDVVQEAYLRFDEAARKRLLDEPIGYLYRIVRNLAIDGSRRAALESRSASQSAVVGKDSEARPSPEDTALHRDELRVVAAAIAELPERTRIALQMHRVGGCKLKDIAARLGISIALAHALVYEGLDHCRRRLREKS